MSNGHKKTMCQCEDTPMIQRELKVGTRRNVCIPHKAQRKAKVWRARREEKGWGGGGEISKSQRETLKYQVPCKGMCSAQGEKSLKDFKQCLVFRKVILVGNTDDGRRGDMQKQRSQSRGCCFCLEGNGKTRTQVNKDKCKKNKKQDRRFWNMGALEFYEVILCQLTGQNSRPFPVHLLLEKLTPGQTEDQVCFAHTKLGKTIFQ